MLKLEKKLLQPCGNDGTKPRESTEKKLIHEVAVGIFDHLQRHKDVRVIHSLLNAVEKDVYKSAITEWFAVMGRSTRTAPENSDSRRTRVLTAHWRLRIPSGL